MLLGIGIDILSLSRFQALLQRRTPQAVAKRICSPTEIVQIRPLLDAKSVDAPGSKSESDDRILSFLSTRWVLKEAAYKSISARYPVGWKDLHVNHLSSGQPTIRYSPPFNPGSDSSDSKGGYDGMEFHLDLMCTLSHDAGVVVGVVIAQTTVM